MYKKGINIHVPLRTQSRTFREGEYKLHIDTSLYIIIINVIRKAEHVEVCWQQINVTEHPQLFYDAIPELFAPRALFSHFGGRKVCAGRSSTFFLATPPLCGSVVLFRAIFSAGIEIACKAGDTLWKMIPQRRKALVACAFPRMHIECGEKVTSVKYCMEFIQISYGAFYFSNFHWWL